VTAAEWSPVRYSPSAPGGRQWQLSTFTTAGAQNGGIRVREGATVSPISFAVLPRALLGPQARGEVLSDQDWWSIRRCVN
jgi:hypothetical protein